MTRREEDQEWRPEDQLDDSVISEDEEEYSKQEFIDRVFNRTSQLKAVQSRQTTISPPDTLQAKLFDFQLQGLQWMCALHECGLSGILADEMGTGKTLQAITYILHLNTVISGQMMVLIVCPLSVLRHWEDELKRFAPVLANSVYTFAGDKEHRVNVRKEITNSSNQTTTTIVLSTYEYCIKVNNTQVFLYHTYILP